MRFPLDRESALHSSITVTMSPKAVRKQQQTQPRRNQAVSSQSLVQASDYDSEAQYNMPVSKATKNEINFTVLCRYVPALQKIICYAPATTIYAMSSTTHAWEKTSIEGTLFVCELSPSPLTGVERHCLVVLNRKGLDNVIIESREIENVEISDPYLLLGFKSNQAIAASKGELKTLGFYIQAEDPSREVICGLIKEHWEKAMKKRGVIEESQDDESIQLDEVLPNTEGESDTPMGRRLSLTELFKAR